MFEQRVDFCMPLRYSHRTRTVGTRRRRIWGSGLGRVLREPLERALRALCWSTVALAVALAVARIR